MTSPRILSTMPASPLPESLKLPIAVVCHDAGGANQIIALLSQMPYSIGALRPVMQGPAAVLWQRAFPEHALIHDVSTALRGSAMLLSGTGWASTLEHDARCIAQQLGLHSVAMLDHWVNYMPRFTRSGHIQLPDAIWVCDGFAETIACKEFPALPVHRIADYYLESQCAALPPVTQLPDPQVLFICEPSLSNWGRERPGEFQALDYFVERLSLARIPATACMRIRPHPSEPCGKYDAWIANRRHPGITLDDSADMSSALANARWVAGCQSYAMVIALAAGRTVFSVLPPWAPACRLPHPGIIHLHSL